MSIYRRKNHSFNSRLSVRRDELRTATVDINERGQATIACLPYLTFPSVDSAEQFVRRVLMQREPSRRSR